MPRQRIAFVLEQTLGHAAHSRNVERALALESDLDPIIIKLANLTAGFVSGLPTLGSWSMRASLAARSELRQAIAVRPVDAIFIHTQVASLLAVPIMREIPTLISLDATPINFDSEGGAYSHSVQHGALENLKRQIHRRAFRAATGLVTWCQWAADSLMSDYQVEAEKIKVIHPGVDLGLFSPRDTPRQPGPLRVLFVGGDFGRKGGPDLVDAICRLGGRAELDVVTSTDPNISAPGVRVHLGLSPQSHGLLELYRRADVCCLPSRGDCFPQAIAEALAFGLPIVATNVGAMSEMVKDGKNGFLVRPGSPEQLTHAIGKLTEAGLRSTMASESLALARREHDALANNRTIISLLREMSRMTDVARVS